MGEEEIPVIPVAAGQVVPTEGAMFKARCWLTNYLQCIDAALSMINLSLNQPLYSLTRDSTMPGAVYKAILKHFNSPNINHNLHNFTKLTNIKMSNTETIISYIHRIHVLIKHMTTKEYKFKPAWQIHFILHSLPPAYSGIVTIIHTQAEVTLDFMRFVLLQHKSSIVNKASNTNTGCDSLLFSNAQPQPKPPTNTSGPLSQASHPTATGKKKDHHSKGGHNNNPSPGNSTGPSKDQQQHHQFPFNPALNCLYCTHNSHSINQCNTKQKATLLQQE
jgi:hypothetical protein